MSAYNPFLTLIDSNNSQKSTSISISIYYTSTLPYKAKEMHRYANQKKIKKEIQGDWNWYVFPRIFAWKRRISPLSTYGQTSLW